MSIIAVGGSGVGLVYPSVSYNNTGTGGTNRYSLPAGASYTIPAGTWAIAKGISIIQYLDPITGLWLTDGDSNTGSGFAYINSDGYNYRIANLSGCPIGAVVTNSGTGYTTVPTVTPSTGASTWQAIVGGAISTTITVGTAGSGYTLPPIVMFSAPPAGGLPAAGYATISAGAVSAITVTSQGAGYVTAPTIYLLPDQNETSTSISNAAATCTLTGTNTVTAVICTNSGLPLTSVPTLAFSGVGSGAAATVTMCLTITGCTITAAGATVAGTNVLITSAGGGVAGTSTVLNPAFSTNMLTPRQPYISAPVSGGAVGTPVIYSSGIFTAVPSPMILQQSGAAPGTAPTATFTVGGATDTVTMQAI